MLCSSIASFYDGPWGVTPRASPGCSRVNNVWEASKREENVALFVLKLQDGCKNCLQKTTSILLVVKKASIKNTVSKLQRKALRCRCWYSHSSNWRILTRWIQSQYWLFWINYCSIQNSIDIHEGAATYVVFYFTKCRRHCQTMFCRPQKRVLQKCKMKGRAYMSSSSLDFKQSRQLTILLPMLPRTFGKIKKNHWSG